MKRSKKLKDKNLKGLKITDSGETSEAKSFIIIIVVIVVLVGLVYLATELINNKNTASDEVTAGEINYSKVNVGTILNRPYDEYYVLVYDSSSEEAVLYATLLSKYMSHSSDKDYIKIYYCDLDNGLNSIYYNVGNDNKSNPKAEKVSDFDFGDLTLLKIKNGKVASYIEDYSKIEGILK